jgi:hypothetical protein
VQAGGHPVAENKIRQRDHRLWALVAEAILRCAQATVYDNSGIKGPRFVAQMSQGFIVGSPTWPDWTPQVLQSRWPTGDSPHAMCEPTDYRSASLAAIWPTMATAAGSVWLQPHAWTSTATRLATVTACWQVQCLSVNGTPAARAMSSLCTASSNVRVDT